MSFTDLGLAAPLAGALSAAGYTAPTAVQGAAIPAALAGADLMVSSQTGSGKTAAFMLPSLQRLLGTPARPGKGPRILVLAPTRELALQVNEAATGYARGLRGFSSVALVGGSPYAPQLRRLSRPVDLAVATPGRLLDHVRNGCVDFSRLEVLVLDEADRMLDMGFLDDIEQIVAHTPASRQTLLFSATLDGVVGGLAQRLTRAAKRIDVSGAAVKKADIEQSLLFADDLGHKTRLLDALLRGDSVRQCVVFAATRQSAEDLRDMLAGDGFSVAALHGDMHQGQRNRTLQALRNGRTQVLVATDVAARGIDVAGISHVINFDVPRQAADYLHRIGRTGRAGRSGVAVTLLRHDERHRVRAIERYTGQAIRVDVIPGLEPKARPQASPKRPAGRPAGRRAGGFGDGRFGAKHARVESTKAGTAPTGARFDPRGRRGSDFAYGDGSFVSQPHSRDRRPAPADGARQVPPWRDGAARSAGRSIDGRKGFSGRDRRG
ncbi:MAG: DEAD/DEAH box helicase [Limnobacter sp.]|nr:DEAD/DEAH box helicase [Limnobacter sp.]